MRIPYEDYYQHALQLTATEEALREAIIPLLPTEVIDSHVHTTPPEYYDESLMPDHVLNHMMSTFPVTTLEQSRELDSIFMPGVNIRKVRFAGAFRGILHQATNEYLKSHAPSEDRIALFGLSDSDEEVEYTTDELRNVAYSGLKMYYRATDPPKSALYDYFPPEILNIAEEEEKPIILHLPNSLYRSEQEIVQASKDFPKLKIILAHIGVAHLVRPSLDGILSKFSQNPNVYVDTSTVHEPQLIAKAIQYLGPEKVLYGTDEPLNLLRYAIYENPRLGPRILTDYPYHWVDPEEQAEFQHLGEGKLVHSHWQQLEAIFDALDIIYSKEIDKQRAVEMIFNTNARLAFGIED